MYGFSNGGAFTVDMGLRHPDLFGYAFAFSPAGRPAAMASGKPALSSAFFLEGGEYDRDGEPASEAMLFEQRGMRYMLRPAFSGHDNAAWREIFMEALGWAFASPRGR